MQLLSSHAKLKNTFLALCTVAMFSACACGNKITSDSAGGSGDDVSSAFAGVNEELRKTAGDRVFFKLDKSVLDAQSKQVLDQQVAFMNQHANLQFSIEGHADERGTREYNMALGERRAVAVKNYLIHKGIAADRLTVISFGKERPEVDGHTEASWSKNRRSVTIAIASK